MITLSLLQTNWSSVKEQLIGLFRTTACKKEYAKLLAATSFTELFSVIWINYDWLRNHDCQIAELEGMTNLQLSSFAVYVMQSIGSDDPAINYTITLHQSRIKGNEPTAGEWEEAIRKAWSSARHTTGAAREWARTAANSARANNWDAALAMSNSMVRALWEEERLKFAPPTPTIWTASRRVHTRSRASHREILRQQTAIVGASVAHLRRELYQQLINIIYNTDV